MKLKEDPETVLSAFNNLTSKSVDTIKAFVQQYFDEPGTEFEDWDPKDWTEKPKFLDKVKDDKLKQWGSQLNQLWKSLGRKIKDEVQNNPARFSLIYLPNPFIVPGGRFREIYYWDSYWVVNGLLLSEMYNTVKGMIKNMLVLVEKYGFVPNGGRIYYTRRSQPPFLIPIFDQYLKATDDTDFLRSNIATLEKEYQFWIKNRTVDVIRDGQTYKLARYAVNIGQPRPESYREDEETTEGVVDKTALYSNIASACETGWDFSTRWFAPGNTSLKTIQTRNIIPVDLNAILWLNEKLLSEFYALLGDMSKSKLYMQRSTERQLAIERVLWNEHKGIWLDFDTQRNASNDQFFASNIAPMWVRCYDNQTEESKTKIEQKVLDYLKKEGALDYPGGVPTTNVKSGQQWDFPNAWPPLQQMVIWALDSSSLADAKMHAQKLAQHWTLTNWRSWIAKGHMYEKYDATIEGVPGGGGEYEVQLGFGWTNGVAMQILDKYGDVLTSDKDHVTSTSPTSAANSNGLVASLKAAIFFVTIKEMADSLYRTLLSILGL